MKKKLKDLLARIEQLENESTIQSNQFVREVVRVTRLCEDFKERILSLEKYSEDQQKQLNNLRSWLNSPIKDTLPQLQERINKLEFLLAKHGIADYEECLEAEDREKQRKQRLDAKQLPPTS